MSQFSFTAWFSISKTPRWEPSRPYLRVGSPANVQNDWPGVPTWATPHSALTGRAFAARHGISCRHFFCRKRSELAIQVGNSYSQILFTVSLKVPKKMKIGEVLIRPVSKLSLLPWMASAATASRVWYGRWALRSHCRGPCSSFQRTTKRVKKMIKDPFPK